MNQAKVGSGRGHRDKNRGMLGRFRENRGEDILAHLTSPTLPTHVWSTATIRPKDYSMWKPFLKLKRFYFILFHEKALFAALSVALVAGYPYPQGPGKRSSP